MVVPSLAYHLQWNSDANESCDTGQNCCHATISLNLNSLLLVVTLLFIDEVHSDAPQSSDAHTYPDGVGVERTSVGVVSLTRLIRRLVQVHHDGDACHEEQEEHYPELLNALLASKCLPQHANDAKKQWQHEEYVVAFVASAIVIG